MEILSRKNYGHATYYLVHPEDSRELITELTRIMQENKRFVNIATKPYTGHKFENAAWVIVG